MSETAGSSQAGGAPGLLERMRWLGWVALLAAVALYAHRQGQRALAEMHGNDFKHIYLGTVLLRHGENPYDGESFLRRANQYGFRAVNPYVYPPTTGLALRPLTWRTPQEAARIWFFCNHAMVLAALVLCVHFFLGWRDPWRLALIALLAATSFPLRRTLTAGQLNCVLLLLYCGVYWGLKARRDWFAGLLVGFGILFKLAPGIFVLYFLWKRRWQALGWTAIGFAAILLLSIAAVGWRVHADYWPVVRAMGYGRSVWEEVLVAGEQEPFYRDPFNQSFNSLFHHLLAPDPLGRMKPWIDLEGARFRVFGFELPVSGLKLANGLTILAAVSLLILALWAVGWRGTIVAPADRQGQTAGKMPVPPTGETRRLGLEVALTAMLGLLLPSIMWDHYLVLLFFPQIVLLSNLLEKGRWGIWRVGALLCASVLVAVPVAFWPVAFGQREFSEGLGLLSMSVGLYGVLILFGLAVHTVLEQRRAFAVTRAGQPPGEQAEFLG